MAVALDIRGISKHVTLPSGDELKILAGLDLRVEAGEVVAILGRSGSGKSTLLNILGLLDTPSSGSYRCGEVDTAALSEAGRARMRGEVFGFIFQQFHLTDRRSAADNVAEPLLYGPSTLLPGRKQRALELLRLVGLETRAESRPYHLSGGEQQRVAIARSLVREPSVILADEPTGALDGVTGARVLGLLLRLARDHGVTLVIVTHDASVAKEADRILTLTAGRFQEG
jgi:putative ABC transport system ATP-binding protein